MRDYTNYLVCAGCGKGLTGEEFELVEGKNFCETCTPVPAAPFEHAEPVTPIEHAEPVTPIEHAEPETPLV